MTLFPTMKLNIDSAKTKLSKVTFDSKSVGLRIREYRKSNLIDQGEMADFLGYTRAAYCNNEKANNCFFSINNLLKIKLLFKVTWADLLGETEMDSQAKDSIKQIAVLEKRLKLQELIIEDLNERLLDKKKIIDFIDTKAQG